MLENRVLRISKKLIKLYPPLKIVWWEKCHFSGDCLLAFLHESGCGGCHTPSPIQGGHAPNEIRLANVGPILSSAHRWRLQHAPLIARPFPPLSGEKRNAGSGHLHFCHGCHQFQTVQLDALYHFTGMAREDFYDGEMGCILGLKISAPTDARSSRRAHVRPGSLAQATSEAGNGILHRHPALPISWRGCEHYKADRAQAA